MSADIKTVLTESVNRLKLMKVWDELGHIQNGGAFHAELDVLFKAIEAAPASSAMAMQAVVADEVWILIRPVLDYEESMSNLMAFKTEAEARDAAKTINDFHESIRSEWDELPMLDASLPDDEWEARFDARTAFFKAIEWPFGISLENDMSHAGGAVAVESVTYAALQSQQSPVQASDAGSK